MSVLVVGEVNDGALKKISRELVSAGRKLADGLKTTVDVLILGKGDFTAELADCGADNILSAQLEEFSAEGYANIIYNTIKSQSAAVVLMPHTSQGKDYSPRVAVKANSAIITDAVDLSLDGDRVLVKKPIYSGKAFAKLKSKSEVQIITVRPNTNEIVSKKGEGKSVSAAADQGNVKVKTLSKDLSAGNEVSLTEASIVVSGGRGMKGPENFKILQDLCNATGAALGASRAAVDSGWISHSHQVGQTGKTVSPNCYIACGISGAIQHLAGMGSSKYIVAINKDPEAPIFKVATYGIVADLFDIVPPLTEEFKKVLG